MAAQRKRGYYLSESGWEKLWEEINTKFPGGHGRTSGNDKYDCYSLSEIADLTQTGGSVSDETISKIIHRTEKTDKSKIQSLFKAFGLQLQSSDLTQDAPIAEPIKKDDPNFVGRESAIATLNALVTQGAKVILIQGLGGIGKTTLANKYLNDRFKIVIEFPIAREKKDIASIKGLLETKLRELGEEPGEELIVSLERLKIKLKNEKIGILIDNLEPALNGSGQFIQEHRSYVELLRALADSSLQSLTLITSREKLNEEGIKIDLYRLSGLTLKAWKQYFDHQKITRSVEHNTLKEIRDAFDGNAEAMNVISKAIITDYNRDLESYWLDNKEDLLIEPTLNNLIKKQFERLLDIKLNDSYNLLCRLGCYRYQDVSNVPETGLICLLWDVVESQHKRTIRVLKERGLVEFKDGEYFLHPVIRKEAISRLRNSDDWEKANCQAAGFWAKNVEKIENIEDAKRVLEAYFHYLDIEDYEQAGSILASERPSQDRNNEPLGCAFYRLGLLNSIINSIEKIIEKVQHESNLARLYNNLGDLYLFTGKLTKSIEAFRKSKSIAIKFKLPKTEVVAYVGIGLCLLDLGNIQDSLKYFEKAVILGEHSQNTRYAVLDSYFCMALIHSCLGNFLKSQEFIHIFDDGEEINDLTTWGKGYCLLYIGLTYKTLGDTEKSFELYNKAIDYAERSNYRQVKAKALTGLGELYRIQTDYGIAIEHHLKSIEILDRIGAKCDLAEAYFQLALTYKAMGDQPNSKDYFDKALKLWGPEHIDAPKQIERVKKAWLMDSPE
jgi:tetratricopeptide (TPR) repeat protein